MILPKGQGITFFKGFSSIDLVESLLIMIWKPIEGCGVNDM